MSNKVEFEIVGEIKTKQRPRATIIGGHARVYSPKDTIYYENYIKTTYRNAYGNFTFENKPLMVSIYCFFKVNQEFAKYEGSDYIPCKTHKDLDNIAKTVLDSLNGIAFNDDKQIVSLMVRKMYTTDNEKIFVRIIDESNEYKYLSLNHLKLTKKLNETYDKIMSLNEKPKLTKTDMQKLEKYQALIEELAQKIIEERKKC